MINRICEITKISLSKTKKTKLFFVYKRRQEKNFKILTHAMSASFDDNNSILILDDENEINIAVSLLSEIVENDDSLIFKLKSCLKQVENVQVNNNITIGVFTMFSDLFDAFASTHNETSIRIKESIEKSLIEQEKSNYDSEKLKYMFEIFKRKEKPNFSLFDDKDDSEHLQSILEKNNTYFNINSLSPFFIDINILIQYFGLNTAIKHYLDAVNVQLYLTFRAYNFNPSETIDGSYADQSEHFRLITNVLVDIDIDN